jgi:hypothetical protein
MDSRHPLGAESFTDFRNGDVTLFKQSECKHRADCSSLSKKTTPVLQEIRALLCLILNLFQHTRLPIRRKSNNREGRNGPPIA